MWDEVICMEKDTWCPNYLRITLRSVRLFLPTAAAKPGSIGAKIYETFHLCTGLSICLFAPSVLSASAMTVRRSVSRSVSLRSALCAFLCARVLIV